MRIQKEELISIARKHKTLQDAADATGISYNQIHYQYRLANIKFSDFSMSRSPYDLTHLYQQSIDGLYVIGFIMADGWVSHNRSIGIAVVNYDVEILHRIAKTIGRPNINIRTFHTKGGFSKNPLCQIDIGCVELVTWLGIHYGFSSSKGSDCPFPKHLTNPLPYLRGYFDGNGCINSSHCYFTSGSYQFCIDLKNWIEHNYGSHVRVEVNSGSAKCWNVVLCKRNMVFVQDLFSFPGLYRKTLKAKEFFPK